ncbi:sialic acid-binding Ig-like lectin 14 isoform X2 [Xenopus laevis]|uniref:Sialic acid-binding Ig-like lectin 14 isoform X2 n=1 Tax=Xenopus laevis TaxID=8355 RepID=A0A8J1L7X0_XENLA|nr:sialic acid-binding Ig-like lectin 14 isoform X2 [Xenopus laevis]
MRHLQPQICQHGFVVVFLLFSLPGHGAVNGQTPGYELKTQESVSVASGLCVEIPCTFNISANGNLSTSVTGIWSRTDISDIVAASTDASKVSERTKGRFTLTGKVHERNCSFSISKAQPEDQGTYVFRIEDRDIKYSYSWNKLNVTVTNLSEPTISPVRNLIAGKQITLTCTSHPAPQGCKGIITWEGRRNIENTTNYERKDEAGKVTSISNITFTPSQRDHESSLTCTVTYSGVSTNSSITLDVEYAPISPTISNYTSASMNCTSAGCQFEVIEGTSLSLLCCAESNPPANLSWAKQNSTDPLNSSSGRLEISHVTTDNKGDYICQAKNKHGRSTLSNTVVIIYAPKRLTIKSCNINGCSVYDEHSSVEVFEGNSLYLQCKADSNPIAKLSWIKHTQNSTVIQTSPTLHLNVTKAAFENGGNYTCRAMNIVGNESKSIFVVIKSPTNDAFHLVGSFCGILVLLLTVIVITALMVKKCKQRRRPPEQAKENESSPPNNSEVVYSNIERRNIEKPNTSLSSPNECKNREEDLQYVTLDFSRSKPNTSREPQETLYSEVRRN